MKVILYPAFVAEGFEFMTKCCKFEVPVVALIVFAGLTALPAVPTLETFVPGYEATSFYGAGAPKNTPAEIVESLTGK